MGLSSVLLSGLFIAALVTGVGYNALAAGQFTLLSYYGANAPSAPATVSATPGNLSATVRWTKPASDGGALVTSYVITPYNGFHALAPQIFGPTARSAVVTGLTNATTYRFRIAAHNPAGTGPARTSNAITAGTPSPPQSLAVFGGLNSATLRWVVPASDGGSAVFGYIVTPFVGGHAQKPRVFNSTATTRLITGLQNGRVYRFEVAANNSNGTGLISAPSPRVVIGVPSAPTGVHPVKVGPGVFKVNFSPGSSNGSPVTRYAAICTSSNGGVLRGRYGHQSPVTVPTLSVNKTYTCTVKAQNARGVGATSLPSPPTTA